MGAASRDTKNAWVRVLVLVLGLGLVLGLLGLGWGLALVLGLGMVSGSGKTRGDFVNLCPPNKAFSSKTAGKLTRISKIEREGKGSIVAMPTKTRKLGIN